MYTLIVTGGIGSGKSAVVDYLQERGAHVISLDNIGHAVLEHDDVREQLVDAFGSSILDEDGQVIRSELARLAFRDDYSTELLNSITHPAIMNQAMKNIAMLNTPCIPLSGAPLIVIELPLLPDPESPLGSILDIADEVMAVTTDRTVREERLFARGLTPDDIVARMARQPNDSEYAAVADVVIDNSGSLEELRAQVDRWWDEHEDGGWEAMRGGTAAAVETGDSRG